MFKSIALALAVIVAGISIAAVTRPGICHWVRTSRLSDPSEKIFHYVNDVHQWGVRSVGQKLDLAMKRSYAGPESGSGAFMSGRQTARWGRGE